MDKKIKIAIVDDPDSKVASTIITLLKEHNNYDVIIVDQNNNPDLILDDNFKKVIKVENELSNILNDMLLKPLNINPNISLKRNDLERFLNEKKEKEYIHIQNKKGHNKLTSKSKKYLKR